MWPAFLIVFILFHEILLICVTFQIFLIWKSPYSSISLGEIIVAAMNNQRLFRSMFS